ncbi:MAG: anthranilate phosphoribosyltransferase, partial [Alphaproteobacteria bacterium]|nr:anthranilate phosphoribosyltransferase [Alphaproteobacteria bacterium]
NISTAVALVVAGCGVPVAKHGNRSVSSRSGSADVLRELGVNLDTGERYVERALAEAHICFMMAPRFHAAIRHIAPVRAELGVRTIFNLLGPLSNPAGAKRQLIGVYDKKWLLPLAEVLRELGTDKAWLVHGADGMDELTTTTLTHVVELNEGNITSFDIHPESLGIAPPKADALKGGDAHSNARALTGLLSGDAGAYRDIVLLNAAAALVVADKAATLEEGMAQAAESIDSRKAKEALAQLVTITNEDISAVAQ